MANAVTSSQCTQLNAAVRVVVYAVIKQNPPILSAGFAISALLVPEELGMIRCKVNLKPLCRILEEPSQGFYCQYAGCPIFRRRIRKRQ